MKKLQNMRFRIDRIKVPSLVVGSSKTVQVGKWHQAEESGRVVVRYGVLPQRTFWTRWSYLKHFVQIDY